MGIKAVFLFKSLVELVDLQIGLFDLELLILDEGVQLIVFSLGEGDLAFLIGCLALKALKL